jgi:biofilm PGA synthesis lipoprotein PgaB
MRWLAILALFFSCGTAAARNSFTVLCYHEVRADVRDYPDPFAVDGAALVRQFEWLRGNGYTPVRLEDIVVARRGGKPLPPKAVLLTFDDAYLSFYTIVYPLLREFRFPALLGVVGKWIDGPGSGEPVLYGEKDTVTDAKFPSWSQLREMTASGLVEIASHSYDLHRGVPANPQGNLLPAATARIYDAVTRSYESDASWQARVRADLARNSSVIERNTGQRPRAVVWPYGSHNGELVRMAGELGMPVALTLEDGANTVDVPLTAVRRVLVEHNPALIEFALETRGPLRPEPVRVVQLSLDTVYHPDPAQQERNLSALLDRMEVLKPTHVWLQATADLDGDGFADAAYFPTRHLPLRADLFSRVAWQLSSRVDVKVYAVLPVGGFRLAQAQVVEVYEDLARNANFDGLVFAGGSAEFAQQITAAARRWRALETVTDGVSGSGRRIHMLGGPQLAQQMRELQLRGELNFGYAGDDAARDGPPLARIAPAMSLRVHPLPLKTKER